LGLEDQGKANDADAQQDHGTHQPTTGLLACGLYRLSGSLGSTRGGRFR
jgi:hypothetical protein